jgi:hypothetical protein
MAELTIAQYAKAENISRQAAHQRVKRGKIRLNARGFVDTDVAARQWASNRDDLQAARSRGSAIETKADDPKSLAAAQRAHQWIKVKQEQLKLKQQEGELAPVAPINAWMAGCIIRAKDIFLRIGPELRDRLAQEKDPLKCEALVVSEVHRGLRQLSEYRSLDG